MQISKNTVVEMEYTLKDTAGEVLDTSNGKGPLAYLHGFKNIIPGLEKELEGKKSGDELSVKISPEQAYGQRDENLISEVSKNELSAIPDLEVGMQLQAQSSQGARILTVTQIEGETVTLDANHPLAGMELHFEVKVTKVRSATEEELAHGHVHGPGGHQH